MRSAGPHCAGLNPGLNPAVPVLIQVVCGCNAATHVLVRGHRRAQPSKGPANRTPNTAGPTGRLSESQLARRLRAGST